MRINKVGEDLYLFIGDTYESNSTVFVAGEDVLLVDALASAKDAQQLKQFVETELNKQVRLIISTHYFSDHLAALNSFPRATVFAHENYRETFDAEQFRTDEEMTFFREPDVLISDRLKIRWGAYTLNVSHNPGHSSSTLAIDVPEADLLFVGDTLVGNILYLRYSTPERFVTALENLRAKSRRNVISSHGSIRSADAIGHASHYLTRLGEGVQQLGWDKSLLGAPLEQFLADGITASDFERMFHARNLETIVERRLFANKAESRPVG